MKKLLILSNGPDNENQLRLITEAKGLHLGVEIVSYFDVRINISKRKVVIYVGKKRLDDYDFFIFRGPFVSHAPFINYQSVFESVVRYAAIKRLKLLNRELFYTYPDFSNKLVQMTELAAIGLPLVNTRFYADEVNLLKQEKNWPLVFKTIRGSQGEGVSKIETTFQARFFLKAFLDKLVMVQDLLPTKTDYRVLVLGNVVLGTMKREATQRSGFVTNASAGGRCTGVKTPIVFEKIALQAAKHFGADFVGVDIMCDERDRPYVLELNKTPGFKAFEKATKINVAKKIVQFLMA